ncbi:hypothetical protein pb186bvf_018747 [Paramecium bursaria]
MSNILLVVGPPKVGKSSLINCLTYGAFHKEFYPYDIDYQVKLAKVQQHKVYEVQSIDWDGKPFGLVEFYAAVADLVFIVIDICGCFDQIYQIQELYLSVDCAKQIAIIANYNGLKQRNQRLSNSLSLFCRMNGLKLYEIDTMDIYSVQMEFDYIKNEISTFANIWCDNTQVIKTFIQDQLKTIKMMI